MLRAVAISLDGDSLSFSIFLSSPCCVIFPLPPFDVPSARSIAHRRASELRQSVWRAWGRHKTYRWRGISYEQSSLKESSLLQPYFEPARTICFSARFTWSCRNSLPHPFCSGPFGAWSVGCIIAFLIVVFPWSSALRNSCRPPPHALGHFFCFWDFQSCWLRPPDKRCACIFQAS